MASLSPQVAPKSELELEILQKLPKAARLFLKVAQKLLINTAIFAIYHKTDAEYITRPKQYYRAF